MVFSTGANAGFHCQGAGILDLLQAKTGTPFLLFANNNGGTDTARRQLEDNPELNNAERLGLTIELFHGDYLFVGQQLLRVEIS